MDIWLVLDSVSARKTVVRIIVIGIVLTDSLQLSKIGGELVEVD